MLRRLLASWRSVSRLLHTQMTGQPSAEGSAARQTNQRSRGPVQRRAFGRSHTASQSGVWVWIQARNSWSSSRLRGSTVISIGARGSPGADLQVVGNLQRDRVQRLEALVLDVVDHQRGQRLHVRRQHRDRLRGDALQTVDRRTDAGGAPTADSRFAVPIGGASNPASPAAERAAPARPGRAPGHTARARFDGARRTAPTRAGRLPRHRRVHTPPSNRPCPAANRSP